MCVCVCVCVCDGPVWLGAVALLEHQVEVGCRLGHLNSLSTLLAAGGLGMARLLDELSAFTIFGPLRQLKGVKAVM